MREDYPHCFACGADAPVGLHLKFAYEDDVAVCRCRVDHVFQGYDGVVHGGIVATLMDEAMAKAVLHMGHLAMTGRLEITYRKPVRVNTPLVLRGWVEGGRGRVFRCQATLMDEDGHLLAEAASTYVRVKNTQA